MKNTAANRELVEKYFADSKFRWTGPTQNPDNPFMLFGIGWGEMFLKCIHIHFDSDNIKPHIELEHSPCVSASKYFYMDLTEENLARLPKTEKEFFDNFYPKMSVTRKNFMKEKIV
jgi:hypothetical protein